MGSALLQILSRRDYFLTIAKMQNRSALCRKMAMQKLMNTDLAQMEALNLGNAGAGPATRRLFDIDSEIRKMAAEYLAQLGYEELATEVLSLYEQKSLEKAKLLGVLIRMQSESMPGPHVAMIAGMALGWPEFFKHAALPGLTHQSDFVRRAAVEGFYNCNQNGFIEFFILASADRDSIVRKYAAIGLAENKVTSQAHRLCTDSDKSVQEAALRAFARPGEPITVRDPFRRIFSEDVAYQLPRAGSVIVDGANQLNLREISFQRLRSGDSNQRITAVAALRRMGVSVDDIESEIGAHSDYMLRRYVNKQRMGKMMEEKCSNSPEIKVVEVFRGKRLVLAGGDRYHDSMVQRLERMGFEVEWYSGFDNRLVHSSPRVFDAGVAVWTEISHSVAAQMEKLCQQAGAPMIFSPSASSEAVALALLDRVDW